MTTIGVDLQYKVLDINGKKVKYLIWDTAGEDRMKTMTYAYYRGCHVVLIVYDVTSKKSFEGIQNWVKQLKELPSRICIAIAANKIDKENRVISTDEGTKFSKEIYEKISQFKINVYICREDQSITRDETETHGKGRGDNEHLLAEGRVVHQGAGGQFPGAEARLYHRLKAGGIP